MADQVVVAIRGLRKALKALGSSSIRLPKRINIDDNRLAYVKAMRSANWERLSELAKRLALRYGRIETQLLRKSAAIKQGRDTKARVESILKNGLLPLRQRADWAERSKSLRAALKKRGLKTIAIDRVISRVSARSGEMLIKNYSKALDDSSLRLDAVEQSVLAGCTGAMLAAFVASFNKKGRVPAVSESVASRFISSAQNTIVASERRYYASLRAGRVPPAPPLRDVESLLTKAVGYARALDTARSAEARRSLAQLALAMSNLIRELLRHIALRRMLRWLSEGDPASPSLHTWVKAAQELPFRVAQHTSPNVSISTLSKQPASVRPGTRITVEGTLGPVSIRHVSKKVISEAPLIDGTGNQVTVRAEHRKLDSAGLVEGSYAKIVGEWPGKANGPLLIVRQRYLDLAKADWPGWVTHRLRSIYEASPQGLMTEWSWQRGVNGAGNQLRYGLWTSGDRTVLRVGGEL